MYCLIFLHKGDCLKQGIKQRFISCAFLLIVSTVIVKVISAVYKIPLTSYIGATGRGYFSVAYNLCMPIHAITMGALPVALTKLVSTYNVKGDALKLAAVKKAAQKLFLIAGISGLIIMLAVSKPYTSLIASSPNSIYTVLALAPSVLFSCLGSSHRAFAEGFLDMKPTAAFQTIEAAFKMVFGLLLAKYSMSSMYGFYLENGTVLGVNMLNEKEALSAIYPITSAFAMLGATIGSIAGYLFVLIYDKINFKYPCSDKSLVRLTYNELLSFGCALAGAAAIQSIANFFDTSAIQYCLSLCDAAVLARQYSVSSNDVLSYVFGIYALDLDFKNLIPSLVMALGVTAVPAISSAYEGGSDKFPSLLSSILKYTVILSLFGGLMLSLFSNEILTVFYENSNPDIVENSNSLLFWFGVTALPCALASTTVYCVQALGFAKNTIAPFAVSAIIRAVMNYILIPDERINIIGSAFSNFAGFALIAVWNLITIRNKTKVRININAVFVKPLLAAAAVFFAVSYLKNHAAVVNNTVIYLMIYSLILLILYALILFSTKSITLSEIKHFK